MGPSLSRHAEAELRRLAHAFLDGELRPLEAAVAMCRFYADNLAEDLREPLRDFVAVSSETDAIPLGDRRALWHPDVQAAEDAKHDSAQAWAEPIVREACTRLLTVLGAEPPQVLASRGFITLMSEGEAPALAELTRALDRLALASSIAIDAEPSADEREAPSRDYSETYAHLRSRFPDLGMYGTADPLEVPPEPLVGDPIDDLADILGDLEEAVWLYDNVGSADGLWFFKFAYETHWGRHLRELSLYLHARRF